jgi:hypothetical protein
MEKPGTSHDASQSRRLLRFAKRSAAYAAAFAPVAGFAGMANASVEDYFGANRTTYEVTLDPWSTLDLGPLGTATAPITFGPFAVEATVHGIPAASTLDQADFFSSVSDQYALQYTYRDEYMDTLQDSLARDGLENALLYESLWLGAVALGSLALDKRVRKQLTPAATAGLTFCALAGSLTTYTVDQPAQPGFPIVGLPGVKTESTPILFGATRAVPTLQKFLKRQEKVSNEFVENARRQLDLSASLMQERQEGDTVIFAYSADKDLGGDRSYIRA